MKKFIFKFSCFSLVLVSIMMIGLFVPRITFPQNLYFALKDKHQLLLELKKPRIIFVGGSNLSFGIDSKTIAAEFDASVINASLHAGLGLKYILNDIKPYLKNGDIVILSPEYEHFFGNNLYGKMPMVETIISNPETYRLFNYNNLEEIIVAVPETAVKNYYKFGISLYNRIINSQKIGVYDRNSFNKYGDVVSHYSLPNESFTTSGIINGDYNPNTLDEVILFNDTVEQMDGLFLFSYPCIMKSTYESVEGNIDLVKIAIGKSGINTLNMPVDYKLNDSLFYNTQYHLNHMGVRERTKKLINNLKMNGEFLHFLDKIRTNE